jgi:glucose/arabinose dehydrogenase
MRFSILLVLFIALLVACQSQSSAPPYVTPPTSAPKPTSSPAVLPSPIVGQDTSTAVPTLVERGGTSIPPTRLPPTQQAESVTSLPAAGSAAWSPVASGLNAPIGIANAGDGSERLFILEQEGKIRILQAGAPIDEPYLDISDRVGCCGERGLLGLAFHPRYSENGFFYVNYTDRDGNTAIARYQVSADDPNRADADSELTLLNIAQPYPNHNGGAVVFGPDGYLYLGLGDGGSGGDPQGNGQSTVTLLGKILRIDVDQGELYAVPSDNPFVSGGGLSEIWAYGLRNPWRLSFDRLTGDLYIADVGQNAWEEINFKAAGSPGGANFGWNYREGAHPYQGNPPQGIELIEPVAEYSHDQGCSVTGGVVYRGAELRDWQGVYLYGDYCSGKVWGLVRNPLGAWLQGLLFETGSTITSFGEDESGEVYLTDYAGTLYRLSSSP